MKITLAGKDVEIEKALPLQLKDLRRLKREFGVELGVTGIGGDVENQFGFLTVLLQKANPEITAEDVDSLTLQQMNDLSRAANEASLIIDPPSSASSTS